VSRTWAPLCCRTLSTKPGVGKRQCRRAFGLVLHMHVAGSQGAQEMEGALQHSPVRLIARSQSAAEGGPLQRIHDQLLHSSIRPEHAQLRVGCELSMQRDG
jgi:hypothetical protein